jgi:hypothetical protein
LTDDQHNETKDQGRVTDTATPIAGRSELQNRESESRQEDRYAQVRQFLDGAKRWKHILTKDFRRRVYRAPFFIEVVGFLVVCFYAAQAYQANILTRQVLEATTRPVVVVRGYDADKCVCALLENAGKNTAITSVRKKSVFSTARLYSGPPLPTTQEHLVVAAAGIGNAVQYPKPGLLPLPAQKGWFYISGLITYGKGYFTRFCVEYAVTPPNRSEEVCEDPSTNDAN